MAFNLLPAKWLNNKRNDIPVRREDEEEHPVYSLQREMNHIFDDFFRFWDMPSMGRSGAIAPFGTDGQSVAMPRIDVHETDKQLLISAELFTRSIPLPCQVDQDSCQASFKNGVLTVSLGKAPQEQASIKSIPIKKE